MKYFNKSTFVYNKYIMFLTLKEKNIYARLIFLNETKTLWEMLKQITYI